MALDLLKRKITAEDFVVFHNNLYQVISAGELMVKMILLDKSKTTKPVKKAANECCIVPTADVLLWRLKQ